MSETEKKDGPRLSSDLRVAVLILAIDQDLAARVLRHLGDDQVERVTRAMKELQEIAIDHKMVQDVLVQTIRRMRTLLILQLMTMMVTEYQTQ